MENKNMPKIPGFIIFILIIVFPPIGIGLLILNIILQAVNKGQTNQQHTHVDAYTKQETSSPYEEITEQVKTLFNKKQVPKTLNDTVTVRCPNCESLCFTDVIPFDCEFCGEHITKQN